MLETIIRWLLGRVGIDFDKLKKLIQSIEIYEDEDNTIHIHFKNPASFDAPE